MSVSCAMFNPPLMGQVLARGGQSPVQHPTRRNPYFLQRHRHHASGLRAQQRRRAFRTQIMCDMSHLWDISPLLARIKPAQTSSGGRPATAAVGKIDSSKDSTVEVEGSFQPFHSGPSPSPGDGEDVDEGGEGRREGGEGWRKGGPSRKGGEYCAHHRYLNPKP